MQERAPNGEPSGTVMSRPQLSLAAVFWILFAFGLYFANLAKNMILKTGADQAGSIARLAQTAIIVFAVSMSLRELGLADDIINLAFGITLGAIGLAAALAFGLGGREVAGRELDRFVSQVRGGEVEEQD